MTAEKEKTILDFIKLVAPGTQLRTVIDDIVRSELGALIIFDSPELHTERVFEGGFRINCRFTPQKLFELVKMDGAIIVSSDLSRILYANVLMTPNHSIASVETGTRHKAAERTAKQAHTFVIAVSERRSKATLYYGQSRYYLKDSDEILRSLSPTLQVLEKQRELLDSQIAELNLMEMSDLVSTRDVCKVIQRSEIILKTSETIKRYFAELGKEGNIMFMRYKELLKGVDKIEEDILKDYSKISTKKGLTTLSNLTFDGLLDLESIARLVLGDSTDTEVAPRGYRFLKNLNLAEKEIALLVKKFDSLTKILSAKPEEFEEILGNRAEKVYQELRKLREQVLSGKIIT